MIGRRLRKLAGYLKIHELMANKKFEVVEKGI